ncbi:MAG: phosphotransferase, partial [Dehalococcoidia bacterium]
MAGDAPPGIAEGAVSEFLLASVPGAVEPIGYALLAGGKSNLTYLVTFGDGRKFVLRRPPLGHILPTAHDMSREFQVLSALSGSA